MWELFGRSVVAFAVACACAPAAAALRETDDGSTQYLGVLGTYGRPDHHRLSTLRDSVGLQLLFGYEWSNHLGLEGQIYDQVIETGRNAGPDWYRWGAGVDAAYSFGDRQRDRFTPFILGGVGYGKNDVYPTNVRRFAWNFDLGAGFVTRPLFWDFFRLRGELRAVYDTYGSDVSSRGFIDYNVGLGVEFLLTRRAVPPLAEAPVVVVPAAVAELKEPEVADARDEGAVCPKVAPGTRVDNQGCALPKIMRLNGVTFEFDKDRLRPDSKTILRDVAVILLRYTDMLVEIAGHTDNWGSAAYNQKLSERRAKAVVRQLVEFGVPASQMTARGYGKAEPVATNATPEGREINRRVELRIKN
jgi:OOP family OmpA-OmpF porin